MKKKLFALLGIFATIVVGCNAMTRFTNSNRIDPAEGDTVIVTSFYPMYILTANLCKEVPGVSVVNLTENQTGCLHDYQLTTKDMVQLNEADLLVINGGDMESFLPAIEASYPNLPIVNASEGISMLATMSEHTHTHDHADEIEDHDDHEHDHEEDEHDHDHDHDHDHEEDEHEEEHAHSHGEYNAHVWMNLDHYLTQMETVYEALVHNDTTNALLYENNYRAYRREVEELKAEYEAIKDQCIGQEVVLFHDAFAYVADEMGLDIIYTVNLDSDTQLSAREVKEIIDEVNLHGVKILFTEEQYSDSIANSIASETGANVYVIDSLVTGDYHLDAYMKGMRSNLEVIKEALK